VREGPSVPCSSTTLSVMRSRVRASAAARSFFRYREGRRAAGREGRFLGSIGVRFMIDGPESAERFSLVEHPMSPRALAAPLHRHNREDEYSFVLEGRVGALLGDEVVYGGPGDLIFKPRNQWHTFWNAGDEPARLLEIISPAGFERFFEALVDLGGVAGADPQTLGELCARYELEMDPDSVPGLVERFGVRFPGEPIS
jgi:mannose-6-phosphate isomerase-like protein (cupin superfamily)